MPDGTSGIFFAEGLDRISDNRHVGQLTRDKCRARQKNFNRPAKSQRLGEAPRKSGGMRARSAPHSHGMLQWASPYDLRHRSKPNAIS